MNRGESYHQLRRAVSYANFGTLRFKTESEQQIWSECSRLITNCIIYYNATLLFRLLEIKEAAGETEQVTQLGRVSPIAWQHINFHGRYCQFNFDYGQQSHKSPKIFDLLATRCGRHILPNLKAIFYQTPIICRFHQVSSRFEMFVYRAKWG